MEAVIRMKKKRKKGSSSNKLALLGISVVVFSMAIAMGVKGQSLKEKDQYYFEKESELQAKVSEQEVRKTELEDYRVYVQTKQYIEKVAKEKLGLVNKDEILLKPNEN